MTLLTPTKLRLRRRIHNLPKATGTHPCAIWIRHEGRLVCRVCGKA